MTRFDYFVKIAEILLKYLDVLVWPLFIGAALFLMRKHVINLINILKDKLKKGEISSLKLTEYLQINFQNIENSQLSEIPLIREIKTMNELEKKSYDEFPEMVNSAFEAGRLSKIMCVDISENIGSAPLYLYVRRFYEYFDLKVIVFISKLNEKKFLGTINVQQFIYCLEKKYPRYSMAYGIALNKILEESNDLNNLKEREHVIISWFRSFGQENKKVDLEFINNVFTKYLQESAVEVGDTLFKDDILKLLKFDGDFIPILRNGSYQGVYDKSYITQIIITNLIEKMTGGGPS